MKWRGGDQSALEALLPLVYDELRKLAHLYLKAERPNRTLQSTALVNEAYCASPARNRFSSRIARISLASPTCNAGDFVNSPRSRCAAKRDFGCQITRTRECLHRRKTSTSSLWTMP